MYLFSKKNATRMADATFMVFLLSVFCFQLSCGGLDFSEDDDTKETASGVDGQLVDAQFSSDKMIHHPRYRCFECESPECTEEGGGAKVCDSALYCWKASIRESAEALQHIRGCFDKDSHYRFTCKSSGGRTERHAHAGQFNMSCCEGDMCNGGSFPSLPLPLEDGFLPMWGGSWRLWSGVLATIVLISALGGLVLFILRRNARRRDGSASKGSYLPTHLYTLHPYHQQTSEGPESSWSNSAPLKAVAAGDSTLREYLEGSVTSGSGSGLPLMVQRTLSKQIALLDCVGKGRYGEVWRGQWHADVVAVKIFFSRDEAAWRRETEIYSTALLRHRHILGYVGSDMTSANSCTQLWLITHYHPLGSLYDYLNRQSINKQQFLTICLSVVSGLLHLHTEIHGTQGKPAIAHRDIKTKNILMKSNGECCIADLGLALARDHTLGMVDSNMGPHTDITRQGTRRYMAPELLDQSIQADYWESWRACDIYALGLVIWEAATCCGGAYRAPYAPHVPADPSFADMLDVVCLKGIRPERPACTVNDMTLAGVWRVICEMWSAKPEVRLPVLRVKKTITKLAESDPSVDLSNMLY